MPKTTFTVEDLAALYQRTFETFDGSWNGVMFTLSADEAAERAVIDLDLDPRIAPLIGSALEGDTAYDLQPWAAKPYSFEEARADSDINRSGEP